MPAQESPQSWLLILSGWAYAGIVLSCLLTAIVRKREPSSTLAWSLAIVFMPVLGPLLFVTFGLNRVNRRLARKIRHGASFAEERSVETTLAKHGHDSASQGDDTTTRWRNLGGVMEDLGQGPSRNGNTTELFANGAEAFAAMEEAILAARHHVHIEFYIFRDDEVGQRAVDVLCQKAREGVQVRVILDGVGSLGGYRLRRRLQKAGGQVVSFLPLFQVVKLVSPNLRNHRKLVVCDGRVAFFGGLNVGREYLGHWRNKGRPWCDLHMRIEGPAVWDLSWMFVEDWDYCTDEMLEGPEFFPGNPCVGDQTAQVIGGGPDRRPNPVRQAFLGAIVRARKRIVIATPYLVPDPALCETLEMAARSGIDVRILTQAWPVDRIVPYLCAITYVEELTEAGVKVFGYTQGMMHAKAIAVDGEWAMVGTANLDNRSMFLNFELMVSFDSGADPGEVEAELEAMLAESAAFDDAWLAQRSRVVRLLARLSRLVAPLL